MQKIHDEEIPNPSLNLFSEPKLKEGLAEEEEEECEALENHDDGEENEDEEEEFSFDCGGANGSPIAAEDIFIDGQIKTVFPLFNRDLLFSVEDLRDSLPAKPPVKNVFVETASTGNDSCEWSERKAVDASASGSASPEICKKSNSTGFSKIWRFKDLLGRSNSDGRDTFVFLNNGHAPPPEKEKAAVKGDGKKGLKDKLKGKVKKRKTAPMSAHEVYLKSKAKEGDQRRSYLPYRPELMGFFTNVNGGLTKNVHPF